MWPVRGRISSQFGWRNVSVGGNRNHGGIDIVASQGTAVAASRSGTVSFSGWNGAYGYVVYVDHADGTQTRYAHLSAYFVGAGRPSGRVRPWVWSVRPARPPDRTCISRSGSAAWQSIRCRSCVPRTKAAERRFTQAATMAAA